MSKSQKTVLMTFAIAVVATVTVKLATKHIPQVNRLLG